jgi:hypothetical protein
VSEAHKDMVRRMVEAINEGEEAEAVDVLFAPGAARRVKPLFAEFRRAFPDWREEVVELVADEDAVAGRFRCSVVHIQTGKPYRARIPRSAGRGRRQDLRTDEGVAMVRTSPKRRSEKFARMSVWVYHAPMPLARP